MLNIMYQNLNYSIVKDRADFFKSPLAEMPYVRSLFDSIKILFGINDNKITLEVSTDNSRVYKYSIFNPTINNMIIGCIFYLPLQKRLDIYTLDNFKLPLIQYRDKKIVYKNYNIFFDRVGFSKLFDKLLNSI